MKITKLVVMVALMMGDLHLHAQEVSAEYTSELQTNFSEFNFVNLLRLNLEKPISQSVSLEASTISIAKTREERLLEDLQTFSNIEENNLPLAIAVCGVNWQINDCHSLFVGIRDMNEDYFTSPVTSFFTNSSCGIFPTISANYPIANYPLASVGMHYKYEGKSDDRCITVQASLYNGTGYNRFLGHDNIFRFCPRNDGIFQITEFAYTYGNSYYSLGNAFYWKDRMSATPWLYGEQCISSSMSMLVSCSLAISSENACKDFIGCGMHYQKKKCELGVFTDYARFSNAREFATEVSFKYTATANLYLQPILHIISTSLNESTYRTKVHSIASLRIGISL